MWPRIATAGDSAIVVQWEDRIDPGINARVLALADALVAGNLDLYEAAHRRLLRRPAFMANLLLLLDGRTDLQYRALHYLARHPSVYRSLLALHAGQFRNPLRYFQSGATAAIEAGRDPVRNPKGN